ncbi:hypothetical protein GQ602_005785 [Ophiocordyceps camponoti-floridani]|uniref:Uncharacterized protein n=1 Tax=Ophiocordyceps camponoti-floridani TaxID=2030778 RepID=A0A8H4VCA6_9HYPO|nr:hypothetical protein GQ602_005785 [Ophiocordyceps camponoti-floridani]
MDASPDSDAMAQAMGFSSFGGPPKKRPRNEAVIATPAPALAGPSSLPPRPPRPAARRQMQRRPYEGHYDPRSNENPWLALEKALDLDSKQTASLRHNKREPVKP